MEQVVDYAVQTARGLTQLHMHGVFHRNIKPHVLLVDLQGNLRITNLFLAKIGETSSLEGEALTTMGGFPTNRRNGLATYFSVNSEAFLVARR